MTPSVTAPGDNSILAYFPLAHDIGYCHETRLLRLDEMDSIYISLRKMCLGYQILSQSASSCIEDMTTNSWDTV